jgi:biopolymer transport protein TolR
MAMSTKSGDLMSEINVTPFIDVMLVLLIIFMVTAPMMIQGVDVTLPVATSDPLPTENENIVVSIDKNGRIYIKDLNVTIDFLKEKLKKLLEIQDKKEVFLRADKDVSYGHVVRVMAEIKAAGVNKLGMITDSSKFEDEKSDNKKVDNEG